MNQNKKLIKLLGFISLTIVSLTPIVIFSVSCSSAKPIVLDTFKFGERIEVNNSNISQTINKLKNSIVPNGVGEFSQSDLDAASKNKQDIWYDLIMSVCQSYSNEPTIDIVFDEVVINNQNNQMNINIKIEGKQSLINLNNLNYKKNTSDNLIILTDDDSFSVYSYIFIDSIAI